MSAGTLNLKALCCSKVEVTEVIKNNMVTTGHTHMSMSCLIAWDLTSREPTQNVCNLSMGAHHS